jgi:murein L,D-transpeptidase YcbB/YkuD
MNEKTKLKELKPFQEVESELELKKIQLALQDKQAQAELALREKELALKLRPEKNSILTSPFLIAILTAISGLIGTGVGASFQGYWNTQLERQKFESSLIQKAVESEDKNEAAKSLNFLIETGILQSLKKENVQKFIDAPDTIPLAVTVAGFSRGATGVFIQSVQKKMIELGYFSKEEAATGDGIFGPKLESRIKLFQKNNGLEMNGIIDEQTKSKIFAPKSELIAPDGSKYE